jgi:hypothetical protein
MAQHARARKSPRGVACGVSPFHGHAAAATRAAGVAGVCHHAQRGSGNRVVSRVALACVDAGGSLAGNDSSLISSMRASSSGGGSGSDRGTAGRDSSGLAASDRGTGACITPPDAPAGVRG